MPGGSNPCLGNTAFAQFLYNAAVTFPTLAANASATGTVAVAGVLPGDAVLVQMQSPPAHVFPENAYVSASGVVTVTWGTDGTGVTGSTCACVLLVFRAVNASLGLAQLPSTVQ